MPTITFPAKELEKLTGKKPKQLEFSKIKAEATLSRGEFKVELEDTNRPDLWSVEGIARHFNKRKEYKVVGKAGRIIAKPPKVRPYIAASVVKGAKLNSEGIKSIMLAQEKLDETLGRERSQTSIGLYRFDEVQMPLVYTTTKPDGDPFMPLGFRRIMTPAEILEEHPKGMKYGHIVSGKEFPIFKDSDDKVLSLPPIINSDDLGKVDETTSNILIEVTGTDKKMVSRVLTLITLCLADRGGSIYSVETDYGAKKETYPDLRPIKVKINAKDMESLLGFKVANLNKLLEKMHYKMVSPRVVEAPCYRWDVMHPVDVFEDVAIAFGFENIEPKELELPTYGELDDKEILSDKTRELLAGIPLTETIGTVMTNPTFQMDSMNLESLDMIKLVNPMSESYSCLRSWLLPSIIEFLSKNTHRDYPQGIFEVGEVVELARNYLGSETKLKVCCAIAKSDATFTDIKKVLETLFTTFGKGYSLKRVKYGSFIEGRSGSITMSGKTVGVIGELHPEVLENWGIKVPVSAFEIDLEVLG
jgi:phenylalanyl-tRNA synthetase beta chain